MLPCIPVLYEEFASLMRTFTYLKPVNPVDPEANLWQLRGMSPLHADIVVKLNVLDVTASHLRAWRAANLNEYLTKSTHAHSVLKLFWEVCIGGVSYATCKGWSANDVHAAIVRFHSDKTASDDMLDDRAPILQDERRLNPWIKEPLPQFQEGENDTMELDEDNIF